MLILLQPRSDYLLGSRGKVEVDVKEFGFETRIETPSPGDLSPERDEEGSLGESGSQTNYSNFFLFLFPSDPQ